MPTNVSTTVTELPESRVRVEAEVSPQEVERAVNRTAKQLGSQMRVPGFRAGKVPPPVIIKRVGRLAVLDEAVRDTMGRWYSDAIDASGIHPVGDPDLDFGDLPGEGEPLKFSIEIGVRPTATLGDYKGVEVGRSEPEVDEADVDKELEQMRDRLARVETVDRAAAIGDFVVMDFLGKVDDVAFPGGEGRDQMIELGSGRLVPGFEDQLQGATAGESRTVTITFPDDYGAEDLAGKTAEFAVEVKEVKAKELPELDDDFASDAEGFDTLEELREDIRTRLRNRLEDTVEREFRDLVLEAVVANATIDVPENLTHGRAHEMWHEMEHSLSHQGISKDLYLQISGKTEEEIVHDAMPEAEKILKREAVLAAVVEAEGIEPSDEEILEVVGPAAAAEKVKPEKLLKRLKESGRIEAVKQDIASRKAVDLLVESATAISVEDAKARDLLYTGREPEPAAHDHDHDHDHDHADDAGEGADTPS